RAGKMRESRIFEVPEAHVGEEAAADRADAERDLRKEVLRRDRLDGMTARDDTLQALGVEKRAPDCIGFGADMHPSLAGYRWPCQPPSRLAGRARQLRINLRRLQLRIGDEGVEAIRRRRQWHVLHRERVGDCVSD